MEDICIDYCEASICPDDCKYLHATDEKRRLDKEDMDILDDLYKKNMECKTDCPCNVNCKCTWVANYETCKSKTK